MSSPFGSANQLLEVSIPDLLPQAGAELGPEEESQSLAADRWADGPEPEPDPELSVTAV